MSTIQHRPTSARALRYVLVRAGKPSPFTDDRLAGVVDQAGFGALSGAESVRRGRAALSEATS
ncbi:hypothetical protein QGN32_02845 [Mycolicibacterium sp. ND9-15]|uniref:hypothetical protein n=1 Tax=Mycolicibacterium sp. ND9-15 TaxID=3042320 RepID=UPI002DD8815F|nr:hypothetical protein [Mycolicibacterium sp. ND9-15]WSE56879.1 hypothetical protein QGN32_02845 [Mycolicibacterium sp. ND9-15]